MWQAIAEENLHCTECRHEIPAGAECLSQMPLQIPENFSRRKYDNFCIECATCSEAQASAGERVQDCYAQSLNHWYTYKEKTKGSVCCGQCGEHIREGTWTFAQKIYAWPEPAPGYEAKDKAKRKSGALLRSSRRNSIQARSSRVAQSRQGDPAQIPERWSAPWYGRTV